MHVDPIKPTLKAPGSMLLKLRYDDPLSNFAFKFNLRRYTKANGDLETALEAAAAKANQDLETAAAAAAVATAAETANGAYSAALEAATTEVAGLTAALQAGGLSRTRTNMHSTDVESPSPPPPSPRVCMSIHPEGKSCSHLR